MSESEFVDITYKFADGSQWTFTVSRWESLDVRMDLAAMEVFE